MSAQNVNTDLWPSFDKINPVRTPLTILKEVAATLGPKTKNLVEAVVTRPFPGVETGEFVYALHLKAPALRGYAFGLLSISYGVELWPVRVSANTLNTIASVNTEDALLDVLKKILSEPRTEQIIRGMISQSMSAAELPTQGTA